MVQYTKEDIDDLIELLQSYMDPEHIRDVTKSNLLAALLNYKDRLLEISLRDAIQDRVGTYFGSYMFDIPFEDLPLYINKDITMTELRHMIVNWRLRRGK